VHSAAIIFSASYHITGYTDLTGEADWAAEMKHKYDAVATHTGARILHMCGVDSIPSEIGTQVSHCLFSHVVAALCILMVTGERWLTNIRRL
jgi:short subunit dehydrogenase-like uncharacterized protein